MRWPVVPPTGHRRATAGPPTGHRKSNKQINFHFSNHSKNQFPFLEIDLGPGIPELGEYLPLAWGCGTASSGGG